MKDQNRLNKNLLKWLPIMVVIAVFAYLFIIQSYSGGYGKVVDGVMNSSYRLSLFENMMKDYQRDGGEWNFGYVVPFAVIGLLWFKREEVFKVEMKPSSSLGLVFLIVGFLFYWVGYLGHQKYFGYAAGQIIILGAVLWFCGWRFFTKVYWLWFLLGMMWPLRFLIDKVSAPLQLLLAKCTAGFLNLIGAGAIQSGSSVITSQRDKVDNIPISLDIDVACSGMRSLFALLMIGLIVAFFSVRDDRKRWVFILLVPLLAVAGNFVRMIILYFGNLYFGAKFAIGEGERDPSTYHICAGLVVFVVALYLMMLVVEILNDGFSGFWFAKKKVVKKKN